MTADLAHLLYLLSGVFFILSLKNLSSPSTARTGNVYGIVGMSLGITTTIFNPIVETYKSIFIAILLGGSIGIYIASKIKMTSMPQLVAAYHSLVGLAAVFIGVSAYLAPHSFGILENGIIKPTSLIELSLGVSIGAITFTGSIIAFAKLQGILSGKALKLPFHQFFNFLLLLAIIYLIYDFFKLHSLPSFLLMITMSLILGITLVSPIGGADMPVVVSMLNSYSGWAAAGIGFTLNNTLLIITGAIVGSSGAILSYIMFKNMNRSIFNVIFGGFGGDDRVSHSSSSDKSHKTISAEDAAFILQNSNSVIIVPGYGMAVAQAQHAIKELTESLKKSGTVVKFAIHPVAGRMPGHMNVLLAEANLSYDDVYELEDINRDFAATDTVYVIGANDVTNPAAKNNPESSIYGMPILDVANAKNIIFVKRSMNPGYAGIENDLFYQENTMMLFGDAKKITEEIIKAFH